jgi:hypothetical protein
MHLKLKVGGWDYKIHWNKNFSLGFGSLLNLKRGGCIWRVETQPVRLADGWCWFILRKKYCWLVGDGWFVVREKHCWLVADKSSEQLFFL